MDILENNTLYQCKQDNCPLSKTGECLEGISSIKECPHSFPSTESEEEDSHVVEDQVPIEAELLYTGDAIPENKLSDLTYQYKSHLILLMGEPDSGKTTLLASLFDQYQQDSFADHYFAGSRTQIGFEKRCFLARWIESGRDEPDTERTKTMEVHYLHLSLRNKNLNEPIRHLLFADVSGEQFKRIRDRKEEMEKFDIINKTDHLFCLVDGALLLDTTYRHKAKSNLFKLIQRTIESEMVNENKLLNVVITKYDKWSESTEEINTFFETPLCQKYGKYIGDILYVASRSVSEGIKEGEGLEKVILKSLSDQINNDPPSSDVEKDKLMREFQKFKN